MKTIAELPVTLPDIPRKRYFAIGEVAELCSVKPHVLRYWEQEFPQLKPAKRRGNRRYYQHEDVVLICRIRTLLYEQGFTIGGARQRLREQKLERLRTEHQRVEVLRTEHLPPPPPPVARPAAATPAAHRKAALHDIRNELEALLDRWPAPR